MKTTDFIAPELLKLTSNETVILHLLQIHNQSTPASLAKLCAIPRPTIYITLEKLKERGLAQCRKFQKKKVWDVSDTSVIKEKIENLKETLTPSKGKYNKIHVTDNTDLTIHRGGQAVLNLFAEFAESHNGQRLLGMSGDRSADSWKNVIPVEDINTINARIKKTGLLTEMITSEDWFKQQVDIFGVDWAKNFEGRATQVHFIDAQYLDYDSQMFIFGSKLYLVSMREEVFIEVKNKQIAKLLVSLLNFVKQHSRAVDINQILREMAGIEK